MRNVFFVYLLTCSPLFAAPPDQFSLQTALGPTA
jgi:hypothetical protein